MILTPNDGEQQMAEFALPADDYSEAVLAQETLNWSEVKKYFKLFYYHYFLLN
jgi:hypothetical protein